MVRRSAMGYRSSDLGRELIEKVRMLARIDLAIEQLGRRGDRDPGDFASQALAGVRGIELDLLLRGCDDARAFAAGRALGLLHQLVGAVLGMVDDLVGALARLAHDRLSLVARRGEL